jgi:hypothetical protein
MERILSKEIETKQWVELQTGHHTTRTKGANSPSFS